MNHSIKVGLSFGLTSAVITTLGLLTGLSASTHSKFIVIGGILTIAIADAFSDALGIHVSEESENKHSSKEIWTSTITTFLSKFFFALTFLIPVILLDLNTAVIVSVVWGLSALSFLSYRLAKDQKKNPVEVIGEHLAIAVIVIIATYFVGNWIESYLGQIFFMV